MKFSIAVGLLFAGLVSGKIAQTEKAKVDDFLRQHQKLDDDYLLKSFHVTGQNAEVSYEKEFEKKTFSVEGQNGKYKVIGSEDLVQIQIQIETSPLSFDLLDSLGRLLPIPNFILNPFSKLKALTESDIVEKQISQIQNIMNDKIHLFKKKKNDGRLYLQQGFLKNMNENQMNKVEPSMLLGGQHDIFSPANIEIEIIQPLIGGDKSDNGKIKNQLPQSSKGDNHKGLFSFLPKSLLDSGKKIIEGIVFQGKDLKKKGKTIEDQIQKQFEKIIQLPFLLGGDKDPDHVPEHNEKKKTPKNSVSKVVENIVHLIKQVKQQEQPKKTTSDKKFKNIGQEALEKNEIKQKPKILIE